MFARLYIINVPISSGFAYMPVFYLTLLLLCTSKPHDVMGQNVLPLSQIIHKLEVSPLLYTLEPQQEWQTPSYQDKILTNDYYQLDTAGQREIRRYHFTKEEETIYKKAEEAFQENEYKQARHYYQRIQKEQPGHSRIWTLIGQTYEMEGMWEEAMNYYETAIQLNPIDYLARWSLALLYYEIGRDSDAIMEITKAHILNRNHPHLLKTLNKLYEITGAHLENWYFSPQTTLRQADSMHITIAYADPWLGYALCKALWTYEPGYARSRGKEPGTVSAEEERECLNAYLTTSSTKRKHRKNRSYQLLNQAIEKEQIEEFIYYELLLPKHPHLSRHLQEEDLKRLVYYVLTIRGEIDLIVD